MVQRGEKIIKLLVTLCIIQVIFSVLFAIRVFLMSSAKSPMETAADYKDDYDVMEDINMNNEEMVIADLDEKRDHDSWLWKKLSGDPKKYFGVMPLVEIWSKAAIGTYLWQHILNAPQSIDAAISGSYVGHMNTSHFQMVYREGPGITPYTVPKNVKFVVLVVNGRSDDKVKNAKVWLDYLNALSTPPNVLLVMLGNEKCENEWIEDYVYSPKHFIKAVLLTYDDKRIDNRFYFQWPLGVATYRFFPLLNEEQIKLAKERKYVCNFQASVYENSSRTRLMKQLINMPDKSLCFVAPRKSWLATETPDTMNDYIWSLVQSDLTLCPSGFNAETYRVYEAFSAGSVPVIEDVAGKGFCSDAPWRLLKAFDPPVVWVESWDEIHQILEKEQKELLIDKVIRRQKLLIWYEDFKLKMKEKFLQIIKQKLFL